MCDAAPPTPLLLTRRRFLVATPVAVAGLRHVGELRAVPVAAALSIVPRAEWGPSLAPTGPIPDEPDVRFLLVHHSVNANTYAASAVPGMLGGIYRFHTGEKGWPDIAYNFFVDRFGGVWEGRAGSLQRAKAVDATGGSQGFAQLCCFLGDHSSEPPSAAAQQSMGALLSWLAQRDGVDLADGARARFTSRGSNRYAAGAAVDVATVAGHRDVSQTACPGNAAYALVTDGTFRRLARGGGGGGTPAPTTPPATTAPTTTGPRSTTTARGSSTTSSSTPSSTTSTHTTTSTRRPTTTRARTEAAPARGSDPGGSDGAWVGPTVGAGFAAAATAALLAWRSRTVRDARR